MTVQWGNIRTKDQAYRSTYPLPCPRCGVLAGLDELMLPNRCCNACFDEIMAGEDAVAEFVAAARIGTLAEKLAAVDFAATFRHDRERQEFTALALAAIAAGGAR